MTDHVDIYSVLDLQDLGQRRSKEIFQTFWNTGMSEWSRVYTVLTLSNTRRRYRSRNTVEDHAEANMLTFLREHYPDDTLKKQRIVMYISTSPCFFCSRKLQTLVTEFSVTLEIVLSGLHHINRPSSTHPTDHDYHYRNVRGLRDLQRVGVVVRTFNSQDWDTLATQILQVDGFSYDGSDRQKEDEKLEMDLQILLLGEGTNGALSNIITNNDDNDDNDNIVPPTVTASPASSVRPDLVRLYSVSDHSTADPQLSLFQLYVVVSLTVMLLLMLWHDARHPHSFLRFFLETAVVYVVAAASVTVGCFVAGGMVLAVYSDRLALM